MIIDQIIPNKHIVTINGTSYYINLNEHESFIKQCELFMPVENGGLETMTKIIADQLIDQSDTGTTVGELKQQLKFLREVGFLMRSLIIPLKDLENG